jgi:hypothetical protein
MKPTVPNINDDKGGHSMQGRKLFSSGLVLGLVAFFTFPAHAEIFKNLKADGSIETRSFGIDNETDRNGNADDYRSETNYRVMVGANFDLLDDVHSRLALTKNSLQGSGATTGTDANSVESTLLFSNAYVKIDKLMGAVDLTVGRQFFGDPNDLIIYFGPNNDDVLSINSIDAFRADGAILGGAAKIHGMFGKIADLGATGAAANSDVNVFGGEVATDKLPVGNLAGYYWTRQIKGVGLTGNDTLNVYGARLGGDIGMVGGLGYALEGAANGGRNNTGGNNAHVGSMYDIVLRYGREVSNLPFRAHVEYGFGTHNFTPVASSRRYGLIWGEHTTAAGAPALTGGADAPGVGLSNLKVFDGGLGVNPIPKLGVDVNAYRFMYAASTSGLRSVGTEYDLILTWKHSDNVFLEANAATFQVGDALQNVGTGTNPITRLGADIKIKF